jgi:hypothetical protein
MTNIEVVDFWIHAAIALVVLLFVALLGWRVISLMAEGKIDLSRLLSEPNGDASLSRFQLLIFTFVIALSLFLVVVGNGSRSSTDASCHNCPAFPAEIPGSVLALLGISAGSYLVSKGIQFSNPAGVTDRPPVVSVSPGHIQLAPGATQQFTAAVDLADDTTVNWSIAPAVGSIDASGVYKAPPKVDQAVTHILVTATSKEDANGKGTATIALQSA